MMDDLLPVPVGAPAPDVFDDEERTVERWTPDTAAAAEWAALRLAAAQEEYEVLDAEIDAYVRNVQAWAERQRERGRMAQLRRTIEFFVGSLKTWGLGQRAAVGGKVTTFELPSATVSTRRSGGTRDKIVVTDEALLVAYILDNPDLHEMLTCTVRKNALDAFAIRVPRDDGTTMLVGPEGDEIPGVAWQPGEPGDVTAEVRTR